MSMSDDDQYSVMLSVIVPIYGVVRFLPDLFDTILAQTCKNYEVVGVDDGSRDGSGTVLDEAVRENPRVKGVHQPNAGVSAARNRGLGTVCGEYTTFIDADDLIAPHRFAVMVEAMTKEHPDLLSMRGEHYLTDGEVPEWETVPKPLPLESFTRVEMVMRFFASRTLSSACTLAWRTALLRDVRFDGVVKVGEDTMFVWETFPLVKSVTRCGYSGYYYRQHSASALHTAHFRKTITGFARRSRQVVRQAKTLRREGDSRWACPVFVYSAFLMRLAMWVCRGRRGGVAFSVTPTFERYLAKCVTGGGGVLSRGKSASVALPDCCVCVGCA